jgi:hypothetical protein
LVESLRRHKPDIPEAWIQYRDPEALGRHLASFSHIQSEVIGHSREGAPLYGYHMGRGPRLVTITAGCHADEPVGPMTAELLPELIQRRSRELLDEFTFRVVPQMNPDGAARNRAWFAPELDFGTYLKHSVRELPGDDIEFGFSEGSEARPECRAAIDWLWKHGPVSAHFSLHGMAWAEGAWFLVNRNWTHDGPEDALFNALSALCAAWDVPQMEIDRNGEKGFSRVAKGISTSPTSVAMKEHFLALDDSETASKFLPSSMEFAESIGGNPLCLVSELPLFLLDVPADLNDPVLYRFRDALAAAREQGTDWAFTRLVHDFRLRPLPLRTQIAMQFKMIDLALNYLPGDVPRSR